MAKWSSTEILDTSFITHSTPNGYEIHFSTPAREKYLAVQEECRRQIDHAKPPTNADRIRSMADEELAELFGQSCDCTHACCFVYDKDVSCANGCTSAWLNWLKQEVDSDPT